MVTVTGGKLTTYRQMAADAVDEVVTSLLGADRARRGQAFADRTAALRGADGWDRIADAAWPPGWTEATGDHLARRYGGEANTLLAALAAEPELAEPMVAGLPYLRIEARHAARHEMATTLTDVLSRRTRALLLDRAAARAAAPVVAADLAAELGWDDAEQARQVANFESVVDAELSAESGHDVPAGVPTGTRA
jgi:glycerol-3-phosphate dehydrogenase